MKRFFNSCRKHRRRLSLLAGGALPDGEQAAAETHLAACADCRRYFAEMRALSGALQSWSDDAPGIEPRAGWRTQWVQSLQSGCVPSRAEAEAPSSWWHALLAGRPAALGGLAAAWMLILFFRVTAPDVAQTASSATLPAPREVLMAIKAREYWLDPRLSAQELDEESSPGDRPPKAAPPPRSEHAAQTFIG